MSSFLSKKSLLILLIILVSALSVSAEEKDVTPQIASALFIQIGGLEKNLYSKGDITVYVIGSSSTETELRKIIGLKIGESTLKKIKGGSSLPEEKPDCLFIGTKANIEEAIAYTRENKIMSVTSSPKLVKQGVSLGFGNDTDGDVKVFINLTGSAKENLDWSQAVMNIATTCN